MLHLTSAIADVATGREMHQSADIISKNENWSSIQLFFSYVPSRSHRTLGPEAFLFLAPCKARFCFSRQFWLVLSICLDRPSGNDIGSLLKNISMNMMDFRTVHYPILTTVFTRTHTHTHTIAAYFWHSLAHSLLGRAKYVNRHVFCLVRFRKSSVHLCWYSARSVFMLHYYCLASLELDDRMSNVLVRNLLLDDSSETIRSQQIRVRLRWFGRVAYDEHLSIAPRPIFRSFHLVEGAT